MPKNQNTLPPRLPSPPSHEVEVCRRKEVPKAKVTMVPFSHNRADIISKGTCARSSCEYWHPPECQFYKTETGCKAGDKCLFPHHEVEEQPHKKPQKNDHSRGMSRTGGGGPTMVPNLHVCKHFFLFGWHVQEGEGRIDVLPWYRLVGVAKTSSETQRRKNRAAREGKWSPRGTGNRQAPPILELRPGNRQGW